MDITRNQLRQIEQYADALFQEYGIDIEFQNLYKGTHFFDRVNDPRNQSPITLTDLKLLFHKVSLKYGDELGMEVPGTEGVLKDMKTDVNMPFILKWDLKNRELDLVPKTIMKKRGFYSKDREYKVESKIKLKPILEQIIYEVGNRSEVPPGAIFNTSQYKGHVKFSFLQDEYTIEIRLIINAPKDEENIIKIALGVDFYTGDVNNDMTNKHQALKLMSYIVGSIEEYLIRLQKEEARGNSLQLLYIKFNPKSEEHEHTKMVDVINRRDRLYRIYIDSFANKYGSTVTFSSMGGIVAKFDPPIIIGQQ